MAVSASQFFMKQGTGRWRAVQIWRAHGFEEGEVEVV